MLFLACDNSAMARSPERVRSRGSPRLVAPVYMRPGVKFRQDVCWGAGSQVKAPVETPMRAGRCLYAVGHGVRGECGRSGTRFGRSCEQTSVSGTTRSQGRYPDLELAVSKARSTSVEGNDPHGLVGVALRFSLLSEPWRASPFTDQSASRRRCSGCGCRVVRFARPRRPFSPRHDWRSRSPGRRGGSPNIHRDCRLLREIR